MVDIHVIQFFVLSGCECGIIGISDIRIPAEAPGEELALLNNLILNIAFEIKLGNNFDAFLFI